MKVRNNNADVVAALGPADLRLKHSTRPKVNLKRHGVIVQAITSGAPVSVPRTLGGSFSKDFSFPFQNRDQRPLPREEFYDVRRQPEQLKQCFRKPPNNPLVTLYEARIRKAIEKSAAGLERRQKE
jgi:hypothetical protein